MSRLYELTQEIEELMDAEVCDEAALERVFGNIQLKAQNICQFVRVLESEAAMYQAEVDRLAAHAKARENRVKQIKEYLKMNMERLGTDKIPAGTFKIALQNNSQPALEADNENEAPNEYIDIIPEQRIPAKDRIKEALQAGKEVKGWWLKRGKHVRIR